MGTTKTSKTSKNLTSRLFLKSGSAGFAAVLHAWTRASCESALARVLRESDIVYGPATSA